MQRLREDPQLDYDTLRVAGEAAGIPLLPIQFGRARRQLGLTGNGATASVAAAGNAPRSEPMANGREAAAGGDATADESAPEAPARDVEPAPAGPAPVPGPGLTRKSTPAFEFLVEALRAEPTISYGELKARADGKDLRIAPIMYGRAKALLGLVPVRPRGQGKNRKKAAAAVKLPAAQAANADQFAQQLESVRNVDDLVEIVKQLDTERRRLRAALEQIASSIDEALGDG